MTQNIFFTSDNHFYHKNILNFCPKTRLGKDVDEMNELMIQHHNTRVRAGDTVYFLGDFSFGDAVKTRGVIARLNGQKHLVYGNHDQVIKKNRDLQEMFVTVRDYHELKIHDTKVVLFHFPMREWNGMHRGAYHLFGHVHGGMDRAPHGRSMDVGIDTRHTDMAPWEWSEVQHILSKREILEHVHG